MGKKKQERKIEKKIELVKVLGRFTHRVFIKQYPTILFAH